MCVCVRLVDKENSDRTQDKACLFLRKNYMFLHYRTHRIFHLFERYTISDKNFKLLKFSIRAELPVKSSCQVYVSPFPVFIIFVISGDLAQVSQESC